MMRLAIPLLAVLILIGCREAQHGPDASKAAGIAANAAKDEAMIARDPARLASFYTDDYLLIDDDAKLHDKPDQVQFMTQNVELLKGVSDDVQVTMLAPDAALVTGRMAGRYRMDGKESDFVERYTGVWLRKGDEWRVKHEHGSLVPATQ
jgi:ketosteroid isomerase-like protein